MSDWQETEFGRIPTSWNYEPLENFFSLITYGFTNPMPTSTEGPYMLTAKDIFDGKIQYQHARRTTKEAYKNLLTQKSKPKFNDILITKDGSIGRVAITDNEDICISQSIALIRPNNRIIPLFLKYLLESKQYQKIIDIDATGSTIQHIYITKINKMLIGVPSIETQQKITTCIHSIQLKLDLLHRQNATLEAMAETLFRQWFVVRRPELVEGEAKEEWEEGRLGDVIDLVYGKALKEEVRTGSGYPVIGSSGVVGYHSEYYVEAPGIVIGRKGTLGKVNYMFNNFYPIDTTYYIKSKFQSIGLFYEYFLLKTMNFEEMNSDSAVPGLNRDIALSTEISIPSNTLIQKFNTHCESLFDKIQINKIQITTLTNLRDTLLPKLMSGEVRVKM